MILITGATGLVGAALLKRFLDAKGNKSIDLFSIH